MLASRPRRRRDERRPVAPVTELGRHYADNREHAAVEHQRAANDAGVAAELLLPERLAEHDHVGVRALFLCVKPRPSNGWMPRMTKRAGETRAP